jgi:hypothetical protein
MSLPALPVTADTRSLVERANVLIRTHNLARTGVAVADLIPAAQAGFGARAFVTDASTTTFDSTVAGGGSNTVPVWSDGTNWKIG